MNTKHSTKHIFNPDSIMVNTSDGDTLPLLQSQKSITRQGVVRMFVATVVAALGPVSFGYGLGFASPATADLSNANKGPRNALSKESIAWFGSLINIGAIVGSLLGGQCAERLGRKASIILSCLPFTLGWLLIVLPSSFSQQDQKDESHILAPLCIGRTLSGIGLGMASVAVPIYIAEVSTVSYRGFLGTLNQVAVTVGVLVAYLLGVWIKPYYWLAVVAMCIVASLAVSMLFIPETPRWLLVDGQQKKAIAALTWLRGDCANIANEFSEIEGSLQEQETLSCSEFRRPTLYKPLFICVMLMFFQQFSGINSVMFFASVITNTTHPSHSLKIYEPTMIGAVQFVITIIAGLVMDKFGRRVLLITSGSLMSISAIGIGVYFKINSALNDPDTIPAHYHISVPWLSLLCLMVYITGFSLGLGAIPWLIMSEILPTRARGTAGGIAASVTWSSSFIVTYLFHHFTDTMRYYGTFWFYGGVSLLAVCFVVAVVPETKGKSLEEIERYFDSKQRNSFSHKRQ